MSPRATTLARAFGGPGHDSSPRFAHVSSKVHAEGGQRKEMTAAERNRQKCFMRSNSGRQRISPEYTLDAMDEYLKANRIGVVEMCVNRPYAPRIQPDPQEWLDAREFRETLGGLGFDLTVDDVRAVFNYVDENMDHNLQVRELERALKRHRKMREHERALAASRSPSANGPKGQALDHSWSHYQNYQLGDEDPGSFSPERRQVARKNEASRKLGRTRTVPDPSTMPLLCRNADPGTVLDCMNDTIEFNNLRISDFFRSNYYNPGYTGSGEQEVDAPAVRDMFLRLGANLDPDSLQGCMEATSPDGSGTMTLAHLENMLRQRRKGRSPWLDPEFLAAQREALRRRRGTTLVSEVEDRPSTRRTATMSSVAPASSRHTLSVHQTEPSVAPTSTGTRSVLAQSTARQSSVRESTVRQSSVRESTVRQSTERQSTASRKPSTVVERLNVFERLYRNAAEIDEKKRRMRENWLVEDLKELDTVGSAAAKKGIDETNIHEHLYEDSKLRQDRLEQAASAAKAQERLLLKASPNEVTTSTHEERLQRVQALHEEHEERIARREKAAQAWEDQSRQRAAAALEGERDRRAMARKQMGVKGDNHSNIESRWQDPKKTVAQPEERAKTRGDAPLFDIVDHALAQINAAVALRCGRGPEDADPSTLSEIFESLKAAIEAHRSASHIRGQEVRILELETSQSPWDGYKLRPDSEGWYQNRPPDVVHQLYDDAADLMNSAAVAQECLLAQIAFGNSDEHDQLGTRWPVGTVWQRPKCSGRSCYAFNPGVKAKERARRKAWVRYAPACDNQLVHLTDLVRAVVVFNDAADLRAGLRDVLRNFEVVDVRNYYHPGNQSLLGERFMEVLVTVSGEGLPEPVIAEIRLEEHAHFEAKRRAEKDIAEVCTAFSKMYGGIEGFDKGAIEYLAEWTLRKPKETHCMSVFRLSLRRRYGSLVAAWRTAFGPHPNGTYNAFREWCYSVNEPGHVAEYWMKLDATRSGIVSLFEVDPEAVILLADVRMRLLDFWGREEEGVSAEELFDWMTDGIDLVSPGKITQHELRTILFPLDVMPNESDSVFFYLDNGGGARSTDSSYIVPADIAFLLKLPYLVNLRAAGLGRPSATDHALEHFRAIATSARGRGIEPGALQGRHALSRKGRVALQDQQRSPSPRYGARGIQRRASRALPPNTLKMTRGKTPVLPSGIEVAGASRKRQSSHQSKLGLAPVDEAAEAEEESEGDAAEEEQSHADEGDVEGGEADEEGNEEADEEEHPAEDEQLDAEDGIVDDEAEADEEEHPAEDEQLAGEEEEAEDDEDPLEEDQEEY